MIGVRRIAQLQIEWAIGALAMPDDGDNQVSKQGRPSPGVEAQDCRYLMLYLHNAMISAEKLNDTLLVAMIQNCIDQAKETYRLGY